MDIEELVEKYAEDWRTMPAISTQDQIRDALTEQAATHASELRAYEAKVANLEQRIRQLEAQRVPGGMAQRPYAWAWEQHAWVVTAHGKHRGIRKSMDVCQPPIQTQESDDFIRMFPLYEHATERVPEGYVMVPVEPTDAMRKVQTWDFNRFYSPSEIWKAMLAAATKKEVE